MVIQVTCKEKENVFATTVYFIGQQPFKATIELPPHSRIPTKTVEEMAGDLDLPSLPQGHFRSIQTSDNSPVAIFVHDNTSPCSETGSRHHGSLPKLVVRPKGVDGFLTEPKIRAGYPFLYGYDQNYKIQDGLVLLSSPVIPPQGTTTQKLTENERTFEMKTELEKCLDTERFTIRADTRNSRKYCPFRGGGDISKSGNCSAVITTSEEEEEGEEGGRINVTPPQPERRCLHRKQSEWGAKILGNCTATTSKHGFNMCNGSRI